MICYLRPSHIRCSVCAEPDNSVNDFVHRACPNSFSQLSRESLRQFTKSCIRNASQQHHIDLGCRLDVPGGLDESRTNGDDSDSILGVLYRCDFNFR